MKAPSSFRFEVQDRVGVITFTRPDTLNSLTFEVYAELTDFFRDLAREPDVRSVVITGEGRGFCSGGDVNSIIGELFSRDMPGLVDFTRMTCDLIRNMRVAAGARLLESRSGTVADVAYAVGFNSVAYFRRCFQVMEADSETSLREWTRHWEDLVRFEIVPVRSSAEAAAVIAPQL